MLTADTAVSGSYWHRTLFILISLALTGTGFLLLALVLMSLALTGSGRFFCTLLSQALIGTGRMQASFLLLLSISVKRYVADLLADLDYFVFCCL